jgi:hypothetical protein
MKTGFTPISLKKYVELHLKGNPRTSREEVTDVLRDALQNIYPNLDKPEPKRF